MPLTGLNLTGCPRKSASAGPALDSSDQRVGEDPVGLQREVADVSVSLYRVYKWVRIMHRCILISHVVVSFVFLSVSLYLAQTAHA